MSAWQMRVADLQEQHPCSLGSVTGTSLLSPGSCWFELCVIPNAWKEEIQAPNYPE